MLVGFEEKLDRSKVKLRKFWLELWKLMQPSRRQVFYLLFLVIVYELAKFASPYLLKRIIDLAANFSQTNIKAVLWLIVFMVVSELVVSLLDFFADRVIYYILVDVEKYLSINAQKKMVNLGLLYHEKENTGNKISRIQRGLDKIIDLLSNVLWEVGPALIQMVFTAVVLFFVNWRFGLIFLFFVPLLIFVTAKYNIKITPYRKLRHDKYEEASGKMTEAIININTVKSFVQEGREIEEFLKIKDDTQKVALYEFYRGVNFNTLRGVMINLGRVVILTFGVYLVWSGNITVGSLVFVFTISEKAMFSLYRISRLYDRVMDSSEAVARLGELEREEPDIASPPNGCKPARLDGRIEFKNVSFIYPNSGIKALDEVNLKVNGGCITALVGPSGGGKTTVARMIYRHYDPTSGEILLDDKNLKDYNLHGFRKFIAIVPQEVEIFNISIRKNIAYARPQSSAEEVRAAARIANADEFIEKLVGGYDALVGERGIRLSGGQRQRLGIARAVLANPKILIFDEATSHLDSRSEKLIQEALAKISQGRTVVIIAHRLSTIKKADKIIVLEDGKVVEQGSHYELAKTDGGLYAKLLRLQETGDVE